MAIELDDNIAIPGETIRLDFEIDSINPEEVSQIVSETKRAVATDGRLDYQGSTSKILGSQSLRREITMLSIWATVRRTRRQDHEPVASVSIKPLEMYIWAAVETVREKIRSLVAFIDRSPQMIENAKQWLANATETTKEAMNWLPWLAVGVLVLWLLAKSR